MDDAQTRTHARKSIDVDNDYTIVVVLYVFKTWAIFGLQESLHSAEYGILTFRMLVTDQIPFLIHIMLNSQN